MMLTMIKILLITWLVGIHALTLLAIWDTDLPYRIDRKLNLGLLNPPEITRFYEDMLGSHLQLDGSVEEGSVIFLGDSLTQGLNVAAISNQSINYGIGMDTTAGLLKRITTYESLEKASIIVIAIGINDLIRVKRKPENILENYQKILESLPQPSNKRSTVFIQALLPVDESASSLSGINDKILQLNSSLQSLAAAYGAKFINLHASFAESTGNLKQTLHIGDGLHLSSEGYRLWISALKLKLEQQ